MKKGDVINVRKGKLMEKIHPDKDFRVVNVMVESGAYRQHREVAWYADQLCITPSFSMCKPHFLPDTNIFFIELPFILILFFSGAKVRNFSAIGLTLISGITIPNSVFYKFTTSDYSPA